MLGEHIWIRECPTGDFKLFNMRETEGRPTHTILSRCISE